MAERGGVRDATGQPIGADREGCEWLEGRRGDGGGGEVTGMEARGIAAEVLPTDRRVGGGRIGFRVTHMRPKKGGADERDLKTCFLLRSSRATIG